ncbi:hypothetical protein ONS95_003057 [Cadophora gregata]|uniref:uncharacterized protein n=1 Tax=Cadophora gregata TaxID=51156 RepID=UPI0026DA8D8F|nr:uncharacterized protein ONS95_003057 [Cadophora gregata]KAK0108238.1 hypothetical protein ONS95_003057 [Cadophora gregata]KAK0109171.1 hypothetical protein ONS96_002994 [Cadophora gregata f. sp. sojae]
MMSQALSITAAIDIRSWRATPGAYSCHPCYRGRHRTGEAPGVEKLAGPTTVKRDIKTSFTVRVKQTNDWIWLQINGITTPIRTVAPTGEQKETQ